MFIGIDTLEDFSLYKKGNEEEENKKDPLDSLLGSYFVYF